MTTPVPPISEPDPSALVYLGDHVGSCSTLQVEFIAQRGRYADITSALNGSQHLRSGKVCLLFSENVDPSHSALSDLIAAASPRTPAVLASPFGVQSASSHGVFIRAGTGPVRTMAGLAEKPDPVHARQLEAEHGPDNLGLLLGRVCLTPGLLHYLSASSCRTATEPRLSLALAAYARRHRVDVVTKSGSRMVDLGAPESGQTTEGRRVPAARSAERTYGT
ncbi:hypothetical protein ACFYOF_28110 [Streptomyces sp. NPDC007148]|uniref:hypothetical protein n=1 Tax=unclassified Streptomyces TaxID=2593676 RepID=UPI0036BE5B88